MTTFFNVGERVFDATKNEYGTVVRNNLLGLKDCPVIVLDNDSLRGFAGTRRDEDVVLPSTGKTVSGSAIELPLDVRTIGNEELIAYGVDESVRTAMFAQFRALPAATQQSYVDQWNSVDKSDETALHAFLDGMLAALS